MQAKKAIISHMILLEKAKDFAAILPCNNFMAFSVLLYYAIVCMIL